MTPDQLKADSEATILFSHRAGRLVSAALASAGKLHLANDPSSYVPPAIPVPVFAPSPKTTPPETTAPEATPNKNSYCGIFMVSTNRHMRVSGGGGYFVALVIVNNTNKECVAISLTLLIIACAYLASVNWSKGPEELRRAYRIPRQKRIRLPTYSELLGNTTRAPLGNVPTRKGEIRETLSTIRASFSESTTSTANSRSSK